MTCEITQQNIALVVVEVRTKSLSRSRKYPLRCPNFKIHSQFLQKITQFAPFDFNPFSLLSAFPNPIVHRSNFSENSTHFAICRDFVVCDSTGLTLWVGEKSTRFAIWRSLS
ncbi:hypothetical protein Droror1_Dr00002830 [Drosera rotundifolia]